MGRYINTDNIRLTVETMTDEMGEIFVSLSDVRNSIEQTPTADVAEVRHGYWKCIGKTANYNDTRIEEQCSICGRHIKRNSSQPKEKYCPSCGTKMDGGKERQ